jgi:hypothetical protein
MDPLAIIFGAVSEMTAGLVHDTTTLIVGMVTLSIIVMGFGKLKDALDERIDEHIQERQKKDLYNTGMWLGKSKEEIDNDYLRSKYRRSLNKLR